MTATVGRRALPRRLSATLPFFYGWVVLGCLCCAGFARQGSAVATLSIFVEPLIHHFGWSRTALSGAVSLGGLLAAISSPVIGPLLDRHGARAVLGIAVLVTGITTLSLSLTRSLVMFYALFCVARMSWAGLFDLGIYGALNNWFVARRTLATSLATLAQMAGLVAMPLVAEFAMLHGGGWRAGWLAIGAIVLAVGFVPNWLFMVRRPEDLGLAPDHAPVRAADEAGAAAPLPAPSFSRREALRTRGFWFLLLYTMLVYPVQAGVSLHQAPLLIERGIAAPAAASIVSTFSLFSAVASLACAFLPRALPMRIPLAVIGALLAAGTLTMATVFTAAQGFLGAALFGLGIGGILTLLPIVWADYFGRANFGAIRGVVLSAQVLAQASGPLIAGALRDWTGSYRLPLHLFAALSLLAILAALAARPPRSDVSPDDAARVHG